MTIYDLKFGDIVTTRNGHKWLYSSKKFSSDYYDMFYLDGLNDNLTSKTDEDYDIMKVERYVDTGTGVFDTTGDNYYRLRTIYKREILDDVEKEYLSNVIKPFRDKVVYIKKLGNSKKEFITIKILSNKHIFFPDFEANTMYKGMKIGREYSVKELGL